MKKLLNVLLLIFGTLFFGVVFAVVININQPLSYILTRQDYLIGQGISFISLMVILVLQKYLPTHDPSL